MQIGQVVHEFSSMPCYVPLYLFTGMLCVTFCHFSILLQVLVMTLKLLQGYMSFTVYIKGFWVVSLNDMFI